MGAAMENELAAETIGKRFNVFCKLNTFFDKNDDS